MVIGLLAGAEVDVSHQHMNMQFTPTQITNTETTTINPTIAPQYSLAYSPLLQLGSPNALQSGSPINLQPTVSPATIVTPTTQAKQEASQEGSLSADLGGGTDLMQYAVLGGIALAALWYFTKKKKRKKKVL